MGRLLSVIVNVKDLPKFKEAKNENRLHPI
jgi:hypothetical protein